LRSLSLAISRSIIESEEIPEAILFLASDKAAFKREPRLPPTAAPQRLPDKPRDWT